MLKKIFRKRARNSTETAKEESIPSDKMENHEMETNEDISEAATALVEPTKEKSDRKKITLHWGSLKSSAME